MGRFVDGSDAPDGTRRAAANHLSLADSWDVFDPGAPAVATLLGTPTVCSLAGLPAAPANAVVRVLAAAPYRARVDGRVACLPWVLLDEAHAFFDGVARPALATQRPTALPAVACSQSDLLFVHRLTTAADRTALREARPGRGEALAGRWPEERGTALVLDDATERVVSVRVRERQTPDGRASPRASGVTGHRGTDAIAGREPTRTGRPGLSDGT
jgi:hypothetical protein